jgi:GT2 family glycosyltransferase/2-polyprenyl-3-methyl-5-hydroxy-6-metoxy-1,4-benzoquinol methylase
VRSVTAADLAVIIPTRDRWDILDRTLAALRSQTASGFETAVVVDGTDQPTFEAEDVRVIVQARGGPGAARNAGVKATDRPVVLFLGDDIIPTAGLVASHLDGHTRHPDRNDAVLGLTRWHESVADDPIARWLEWSGLQFDYGNITGEDAGWGRFYSSNVSLKREFFLAAGGFDEDFSYDYEDLDLAWRLHQQGIRLWYAPNALGHHLHAYDWEALARRWESHARAERVMAAKHPWFTPFFADVVNGTVQQPRPLRGWSRIEPLVPDRLAPVRSFVRDRAGRTYVQRLAPRFLAAWEGEADLDDLRAYLGDAFDTELLHNYAAVVDRERDEAPDEDTFYRTSKMYLYDLTAFAMTGTKHPYLTDFRWFVESGTRVLDYGCGIGSDGLRLLRDGYRVEFADFANPSAEFLRWRLARHDFDAPVFDLDRDEIPAGYRAAYSLDVIEHVDDPFAFLDQLERRADIVMVNFLDEEPDDTHLHHQLPIGKLLDHADALGILRYRLYHDRSHFVIYRTRRPGWRGQARSAAQRRLGPHMRGSI